MGVGDGRMEGVPDVQAATRRKARISVHFTREFLVSDVIMFHQRMRI
jgi:hypothetical protein